MFSPLVEHFGGHVGSVVVLEVVLVNAALKIGQGSGSEIRFRARENQLSNADYGTRPKS